MTELKIESSPIWDILGVWSFFNFIANSRIGTIPGVEDLQAGFSSKALSIPSAQALFRPVPPSVWQPVLRFFQNVDDSNDDSNNDSDGSPNNQFTDLPGDQRLLSSSNFLNGSLGYACSGGSLDQARIILDLCFNAGINEDSLDTPLCRAVEGGHYLVVRLLIERGADVNKSGPLGDMPLCTAALWGHHLVVRLLIEKGADVNMSCRGLNGRPAGGDTPLNYAVLKGHTHVVKELLKVPGVRCTAANCDLMTPLTTAFLLGRDHPIRKLLRDYVERSERRYLPD
jgi:ankyrin repeat protein